MTTATILEIGMATDVIAEPHFVKREQLDSILYLYCFFYVQSATLASKTFV